MTDWIFARMATTRPYPDRLRFPLRWSTRISVGALAALIVFALWDSYWGFFAHTVFTALMAVCQWIMLLALLVLVVVFPIEMLWRFIFAGQTMWRAVRAGEFWAQRMDAGYAIPAGVDMSEERRLSGVGFWCYLAQCVPIITTHLIVEGNDGDATADLPLVVVDATQRPEIADLLHMQAHEGDEDVTYGWAYLDAEREEAIFAFSCTYQFPVHARFRLAFPLREHAAFLETIGRTRQLGVALCAGAQVTMGAARMLIEEVAFLRIALDEATTRDMVAHLQQWHSERNHMEE